MDLNKLLMWSLNEIAWDISNLRRRWRRRCTKTKKFDWDEKIGKKMIKRYCCGFSFHSIAFASRKVNKLPHQTGTRDRGNARSDSKYRNGIWWRRLNCTHAYEFFHTRTMPNASVKHYKFIFHDSIQYFIYSLQINGTHLRLNFFFLEKEHETSISELKDKFDIY